MSMSGRSSEGVPGAVPAHGEPRGGSFRDALLRECAAEGQPDDVLVGRVLALAAHEYFNRTDAGSDMAVFGDTTLTVTEVAVVASAMLDAVELEVFELGMWQSLGSV